MIHEHIRDSDNLDNFELTRIVLDQQTEINELRFNVNALMDKVKKLAYADDLHDEISRLENMIQEAQDD